MTRIAAWEILRAGTPSPLRAVDRRLERGDFDARDGALLRRLIGIETRQRGALRAMVRLFARRKPKPEINAHLHLGLAQLFFFDRIPDHAAVSETLVAVNRTIGQSKVRVVNAILREALRNRAEGKSGDPRRDFPGRNVHFAQTLFRDPVEHPYLWAEDALSIPAHLMKRWAKRYGWEGACRLGTYFLSEPALVVRAVGRERDELREELATLEAPLRDGSHARTFVFDSSATSEVTACDAFREGRITIQGEAALTAAEMLQAQPGERVLDLCAAPGGKTAALSESGARVIASDVQPARLALVRANAERLGFRERASLVCADGARAFRAQSFDAVLVDAPCSNSGVLGARPGARWRFGPGTQRSLRELQSRLLRDGARVLRPGGRLVWSTCSLEPEENGQLVRAFVNENPGWEVEAEHETLPAPPEGSVDGGYAARLRRPGA